MRKGKLFTYKKRVEKKRQDKGNTAVQRATKQTGIGAECERVKTGFTGVIEGKVTSFYDALCC